MTPIFDESEGLIYRIELWTEDDQHVDALLAKCARLAVAYGALEAAIAEYPGRNVTLRQRTRLLAQLERLEGKVMSRFVAAGVNNQGLAGPGWADLSV
jgi:hypothetical protein